MAVFIQNFQLSAATVSSLMSFYYQANKQTEEDCRLKQSIRSEIENILSSVGFRPPLPPTGEEQHRFLVHITGSTADGFGLADSDLDLTLVRPSFQALGEDQIVLLIQYIIIHNCVNIQLKHPTEETRSSPESHVPIVCFNFTPNPASVTPGSPVRQMSCDFSIRHETTINNARLLAWFARTDPRALVLFTAIKKWATSKGVYGTQGGYLNSFPWKLLLIHYLQQGCTPALFPKVLLTPAFRELPRMEIGTYRYTNMAELLSGFFEYYSRFRFGTLRVSVTNSYQPVQRLIDTFPMYIEDPYDPQVNCARALTLQTVNQLRNALANGYGEAVLVVLREVLSNLSHISFSG